MGGQTGKNRSGSFGHSPTIAIVPIQVFAGHVSVATHPPDLVVRTAHATTVRMDELLAVTPYKRTSQFGRYRSMMLYKTSFYLQHIGSMGLSNNSNILYIQVILFRTCWLHGHAQQHHHSSWSLYQKHLIYNLLAAHACPITPP